jgi:hypothetical protein
MFLRATNRKKDGKDDQDLFVRLRGKWADLFHADFEAPLRRRVAKVGLGARGQSSAPAMAHGPRFSGSSVQARTDSFDWRALRHFERGKRLEQPACVC